MKLNGQSETGKIKSILLAHPKRQWLNQSNIDSQWKALNYLGKPQFDKALAEYDKFVDIINEVADEIIFLDESKNDNLDSIYTHDPVIITRKGAILCSMGKDSRKNEPGIINEFFKEKNIPILGEISGDGRVEGGDIVWLDDKTICVGEGYRTNPEGIAQLQSLLNGIVEKFVIVPLPHWRGSGDVLHLMSMISPVDHNKAVVYSRLMPVRFREFLLSRDIELIEVPDDEYDSMGCNILALEPGKVLMLAGNFKTKEKLISRGVEVLEYEGAEISLKGSGGPTCLTRPLLRE